MNPSGAGLARRDTERSCAGLNNPDRLRAAWPVAETKAVDFAVLPLIEATTE
jgi:hypothetical protein